MYVCKLYTYMYIHIINVYTPNENLRETKGEK